MTILLIRHAAHDLLGRTLCGRMEGVGLGTVGLQQAKTLALRVRAQRLDAVYTSPMQRTRETAAFLSPSPTVNPAFDEIDFGSWTGRSLASLEGDADWRAWNTARSQGRAPGGESMEEVQHRAIREIGALSERYAGQRIAIVSHGDVIKAVLAGWLGMSLDSWWRFEISPASVSSLMVWAGGGKVASMNETVLA